MISVSHDAMGAATIVNTSAELSEVLQKDIHRECDGLLSEYMSPRLKKRSGPNNMDEAEPPPEIDEDVENICEEEDDEDEEEDGDEGLDELIMIDEAEQEEREKKLAGSEDAEIIEE